MSFILANPSKKLLFPDSYSLFITPKTTTAAAVNFAKVPAAATVDAPSDDIPAPADDNTLPSLPPIPPNPDSLDPKSDNLEPALSIPLPKLSNMPLPESLKDLNAPLKSRSFSLLNASLIPLALSFNLSNESPAFFVESATLSLALAASNASFISLS